jgi:hypothetical protein
VNIADHKCKFSLGRVLSKLVLVMLGLCSSQAIAEDPSPSFFYEFGVEVVYRGKPLKISRVVECVQPMAEQRTFPATGRSQEAIAERLDDGSGLIVDIPSLCDVWPLSPDYVPLIFWTDNAETHEVLETYLSEPVLRSGKARITLKSVFARSASQTEFAGTSKDFVLFGLERSGGVFRDFHTKGSKFIGFSARVLSQKEWMQVPSAAAVLPTVKTPGMLPREAQQVGRYFPSKYDWDSLVVQGWRNRPYIREALDNSIALRWVNDAFELDRSLQGRALVYAVRRIPTVNMTVVEREGVLAVEPRLNRSDPKFSAREDLYPRWRLRVDDQNVEIYSGGAYFEPVSQQIISLQIVSFFLFENSK